MDEEDLEELRNAKEMKTNQRFAEAAEPGQRNYDPFAHLGSGTAGKPSSAPLALGDRADAAFADLIKPSTSRAGEKILQKMGWKPGQGIGPRVTRKRRLQVAKQLGVTLGGDDDGEAEDTEDDKHLYAPVDRPLILFQARSGTAGLGYTKAPTLRSDLDRLATGGYRGGGEVDGKKMPQGASFGLGALNDAEIDDEDPYATGSGPAFASDPRASRLLVDDSEDAHLTPFSSRKTGPQPPPTAAPAGYFSDGKPMVKGFVLASEKRKEDTWYKAPEPPRNWEPDPRAMWERIKMGQLGAMRPSGPSTGPLNADEVRFSSEPNPNRLLTRIFSEATSWARNPSRRPRARCSTSSRRRTKPVLKRSRHLVASPSLLLAGQRLHNQTYLRSSSRFPSSIPRWLGLLSRASCPSHTIQPANPATASTFSRKRIPSQTGWSSHPSRRPDRGWNRSTRSSRTFPRAP